MRTLLLMRGAPGAGKSTWIANHNLQAYTLSPDDLRVLCSSKELQPTGELVISQERENENVVWEILMKILEHRMNRGEFTVIDATCSKTKDMQKYKELADSYRYRICCVDFTDVPIEVCKAQNKQRPEYKWVPEEVIENIYARFATQKIPGGISVIKPDEFDSILEKPVDLSEYKKLVFIGDIHGCYDTLMQYPDFKDGLKDDTEYIFLGDYIDRGNQNAEVMNWLQSIMNKPNVCLLEGNHERWIKDYGNDVPAKSREFNEHTMPVLVAGGYDQKMARMFYRKLRQMSHIIYKGADNWIEILACHGGIPNFGDRNLLYMPSSKFVRGVGNYEDSAIVADTWMKDTNGKMFLVHGHRNIEEEPVQTADRVFNLEGKVEFGGQLRIVELTCVDEECVDPDTKEVLGTVNIPRWKVITLDDCQPITEELKTEERTVETVEEAVSYLRNNKFVQEKDLGDGISSFNFTREAFFKGNWNRQTILARGLFIDTENNTIMARSYEKFFKINEVHATELSNLKNRFVFPVTAYVKENGFLAIVSYNYKNDDLFVASKSTDKGEYANYIRTQLEPYAEKLKFCLKQYYDAQTPISIVFECENVENDPHIIKYANNKIVMLDAIYNTLDYKALSYEELKNIQLAVGCPIKEKAFVLKNWDEFRDLYNDMQDEEWKYKGNFIEGFVFVDSTGFMTKCKSAYYNFWKFMRGIADQTLRKGYIRSTGSLYNSTSNLFYGFCKDLYNNDYDKTTKRYPYATDIISLRDKFINRFSK